MATPISRCGNPLGNPSHIVQKGVGPVQDHLLRSSRWEMTGLAALQPTLTGSWTLTWPITGPKNKVLSVGVRPPGNVPNWSATHRDFFKRITAQSLSFLLVKPLEMPIFIGKNTSSITASPTHILVIHHPWPQENKSTQIHNNSGFSWSPA